MSVDPVAIITAIGTLLLVVFGYLKQRGDLKIQAEALANERKAREDAEKKSAKKDDLDALRAIIDELQERLATQHEQHARDRAQWEGELLSVRQLHAEEREQWRKEREQWRIDKAELTKRIRQLEGNRRGLS